MAKSITLKDETGLTLKEAIDGVIEDLMLDYNLSKAAARKVFTECIVRRCVYEEISGEAAWLMGRDGGDQE